MTQGQARGSPSKALAWVLLAAFGVPLAAAATMLALRDGASPPGAPGALVEEVRLWRAVDGRLPELVDITEEAGFDGWRHSGRSEASGGAAMADVDDDGTADIVVGGGSAGVFFGGDGTRWQFVELLPSDAAVTSVAAADIDGDTMLDIVFGTAEDDIIFWGGPWARQRSPGRAERAALPSGRATTGLLVADLNGDGRRDLVRLGYGSRTEAASDVVWVQTDQRSFDPVTLPGSKRRSLAAEVTDIDEDGHRNLWVTRDVGWLLGEDSVYELDAATGEWHDRARELGADLAIDGMGVTVADLTDDGRLDVYLSDLGDNELLERLAGGGYRTKADIGLARIRPPGADARSISSSWGSAAVDLNLDGRLDMVVANGGFGQNDDIANKIEGTTIVDEDPPALLLGRADTTYADVWPDLELGWSGRSRGMSAGDLDGDGDTDLVFVVHGVGLRVLRNDTDGPAVRVRPAQACDASGATVTVTSDLGTTAVLLAPHTFLGAHAAEHIAGTSGPTEVTVRYVGADVARRSTRGDGRAELVVPCPRG